jgi:hypothetical protein
VRAGPLAGDEAAVPAQDGTGGYQPVHPQPSGQEPDERGEDCSVCPVQPWLRVAPAQHGDLMSQHEQHGVLGGREDRLSGISQLQCRAEPDEDEIEQAQGHG